MEPKDLDDDKLESVIQKEILDMMRKHEWFVMTTHGNSFQSGFPDIFACHRIYGHRWIEVKRPKGYKFTGMQLRTFPMLCANRSGVWVLIAATEHEYKKLFQEPNWIYYLL